jgi:hypothetical protein
VKRHFVQAKPEREAEIEAAVVQGGVVEDDVGPGEAAELVRRRRERGVVEPQLGQHGPQRALGRVDPRGQPLPLPLVPQQQLGRRRPGRPRRRLPHAAQQVLHLPVAVPRLHHHEVAGEVTNFGHGPAVPGPRLRRDNVLK